MCALADRGFGLNIGEHQRIPETYGNLPLAFEPNWGQIGSQAAFLVRCRDHVVFLEHDALTFALYSRENSAGRLTSQYVRIRFEGAKSDPPIEGYDLLPGRSNYIIGQDAQKWLSNIPQYARVSASEVYPGITLNLHSAGRNLEYDWVLAADADASRIRLRIDGARRITLNERGDLVAAVRGGQLVQTRPYAYQVKQGTQLPVTASYRILDDQSVVFDLGAFDSKLPLTIDPTFVYSTEFGGEYSEGAQAIAVDQAGSAYIVGGTPSLSFPTVNAIQSIKKDMFFPVQYDGFVTKLNPTGTSAIYSTYLGGSQDEQAHSIAVDSSGAYVSGYTTSTDFPIVNAMLSTPAGGWIAKLNAAGSALAYSTYLNGGSAVAVNSSGAAYVGGGITTSAFFSKIDPTGTSINFAAQFGDGTNGIQSIAVDPTTGDVVVGGTTRSLTLPTMNAFQSTRVPTSGATAFVTKFNSTGTALIYSTYLGGSVDDRANGIALGANGVAYVVGVTSSPDFPVTSSAIEPGISGCFVTIFGATGDLFASSYLGADATSRCTGVAVDAQGNVFVSGSAAVKYPEVGTIQPAVLPNQFAFVTKLKPDLSALVYSTVVGKNSQGQALALDSSGNVYLAANAVWPGTYPLVNSVAFGTRGNDDVGVSKIADDTACQPLTVSPANFTFDALGGPATINVSVPATCSWNVVVDGAAGPALSVENDQQPFTTYTGSRAINFSVGGVGLNHPTAVVYLVVAGQRVKITQTGNSPTPVLSITKSHSGNFSPQQQNVQYTLTVSNATGGASTSGAVIVTESLPSTLSTVSMAGTGWTCPGTAANNCSRTNALAGGASYPPIIVTANVAASPSSVIVNEASVSGGGSLSSSVLDYAFVGPPADFSVSMSPGSESVAASITAAYQIVITGVNDFHGQVTLGISGLPAGASASFGPSQVIGSSTAILTITTTAGTPQGTFALTITGTSGTLTHTTSAYLTITESRASLNIIKTHTRNFIKGQMSAEYAVTVLNAANATPTVGAVTVTEMLPSGLTLVRMLGTGWSCVSNTCSRNDVLGTGAAYPPIQVLVNVASSATSPQVNQVSVSGGGSITATAADSTAIDARSSHAVPRIGVFENGIWMVDMDANGQLANSERFGWGAPTDQPVLGDWNGSGTTKAGVFRNGLWFLDLAGNHQLTSSSQIVGWGQTGDLPVVGDWNNSGTSKIGVFRNGLWFLDLAGTHQLTSQNQIIGWGQAGDVPVMGDWNGDGATKIGVFRNGIWYLDIDGSHQLTPLKTIGWGQAGDIPVVGDWNGSGTTKIGVYRNGLWFLDLTGNHQLTSQNQIIGWGQPTDTPVVGDWDTSGTSKIGVFSSGTWFLDSTGNHQLTSTSQIISWGKAGDRAEPGGW